MIVLFDMDGTLTPAREEISWEVVSTLRELTKHSRVGIISGSDMEYILQQCEKLISMGGADVGKVDILPCNGTKLYKWKYTKYEIQHEADMIEKIGKTNYRNVLKKLFEMQAGLTMLYPDVPYTGTFVQYRGSLLNWCPIGRSADGAQRKEWCNWDENWKIRETYFEELTDFLAKQKMEVTVALGGSTSFDIYPNGWNKTYGLQHYPDEEVYFIGDKCMSGGNDWHIYEALKDTGRAWKTSGPDETIRIVKELIEKLKTV